MYDNNGIVVLGSHSLNECITTMPCSQIFSIVKFSVTRVRQRPSYKDAPIALITINCDVGLS